MLASPDFFLKAFWTSQQTSARLAQADLREKLGLLAYTLFFYHNTIMLNVVQIRPLSLLENDGNDTSGQVLQNLQNGMCT